MIEVRGGPEQLARISRQVKQEAKNLQRELDKALSTASQPFKREASAAALDRLPTHGGFSQRVARARVGVRNRSARGKGVQITYGAKRSQMEQINRGFVFHPVFGGDIRVRQAITPGFADAAAARSEAEVSKAVEEATGRMADRIDRAGRGL